MLILEVKSELARLHSEVDALVMEDVKSDDQMVKNTKSVLNY